MGLLDRIFGGERHLRDSEFAGIQYPADGDELGETIDALLEGAEVGRPEEALRGIVAPYGDYEYAGPVMAAAYAPLAGGDFEPERVLAVASSLRVPFRGVAVAGWDGLELPNGEIPVDLDAVEAAVDEELARPVKPAFEAAAGLELQLPFLRHLLPGVPCVPALVGDGDEQTVAAFLERFWSDETLLVVGANLSEGFEAERAARRDAETVEALESLEATRIERDRTTARLPLRALVEQAERRGLQMRRWRVATSAETAGSTDKVVGYAAMWVTRRPPRDAG